MSMHDRAEELRAKADLWPEIEQHLQAAQEDAERFMLRLPIITDHERSFFEWKYRMGEAEHKRDWLDMTRDRLLESIKEEVLDLVLYHAMLRARWVDASYTTDEDPGDE